MVGITRVRTFVHVLVLCGLLLSFVGPAGVRQPIAHAATASGDITYVYDAGGRVVGVVDPTSDTGTYTYDAVGNVRSIARRSSMDTSIIEFTPHSAPVGSTVTLFGTGFRATASENTVAFNGVTATVTSASATTIVVTVPTGATTGSITVTTSAGSATSATAFTVVAQASAPTITTMTPTIGTPGTAVTLTGTNFDTTVTHNKVTLNTTFSEVISTTTTMLEMKVPPAATSGKIAVTTAAGSVIGSTDFFVPPGSYGVTDVEFMGRVAIGANQTVTIATANKVGLLLFDGDQGQQVSLQLSNVTISNSKVSIYSPDGALLVSPTSFGTSGGVIDAKTLPATGTYTILIDPNDANTGAMDVMLHNAPAVTSPITPGGDAVSVSTTVPGQYAKLTFSGTANQRISLQVTTTNKSYYLQVRKPDGTDLIGRTWVGSNHFFDTTTLPVTGTYTIEIDPYQTDILTTSLRLYDVPADTSGTITIGGDAATISTTAVGQNASLTFTGTANQRISALVTTTNKSYYLRVRKPDGTDLIGRTWVGSNHFFDTTTLPATGTYTIEIDPYQTDILTTSLRLYDVPADVTGTITIGGDAVTSTITTPGQNAKLTFSGTANQQVTLQVSGVTIASSSVSIRKPDNASLVSKTIGTSGGSLSGTLSVDGTYSIIVDPATTNIGNMTLTLTAAAGGTQADPAATSSRQNEHSQNDALAMQVAPEAPSAVIETAHEPAGQVHATEIVRDAAPETTAADVAWEQTPDLLAQDGDDEAWVPGVRHRRNWKTGQAPSPWQNLPPLQAASGVTALAGQVLTLNGKPLRNVTLQIDEHRVRTNRQGQFLLTGLEAGFHELVIDGRTANTPRRTYGVFEARVHLTEGQTTVLPYTIWMSKLDTAHTITITSPTTEDVVLTTPHIPGLEVRIPKGAVITDEDGQPVTEIGITPIPVDRPPFPLPKNTEIPIYFTVQPGGAYVTPAAQVIYPNYLKLEPGTRTDFWNYDPDEKEWYLYGHGTVTADGRQVVPDPDTVIYEFSGAMFSQGSQPPAAGPTPGGAEDGDPVDLSTGLFVFNKTDLILPDTIPLVLSRTYRPNDSATRPFGRGANHPYGMFLWSARQYEQVDLVLPDGARIHYPRISSGTGYTDAVFEHTATPTVFYQSRIAWNGDGWNLTLRDGTVYIFGENAPLQAIRDRLGNQITLTRANGTSGNITRLRSPNGRWIAFTYDGSNRITQAKDNSGRTIGYEYDSSGRLWKVTNPDGGVTEYSYDSDHRMLTIKDARGITFLTNEYDSNGRVKKQTQADTTTYQFAYTVDSNDKITQTDVTDPRGAVRRVTFNAAGYPVTETYALDTDHEQTVTYERQAGTNKLLRVTDPLNRQTTYAYDAKGNVLSVTTLAGTTDAVTTTMTYEATYNQVTSITEPLTRTTTMSYDTKGNLTAVTDPLGHQTTFAYTTAGQLTSTTDAAGKVTRLSYDGGNLARVTDPLGQQTTRFTDSIGRIVRITNALGNSTRYDYDSLSRPQRVTDPLGQTTSFTYDANGNLLTLTDARNNRTSYTYNDMDRLITRTDPLNRVEQMVYDANGNLTRATDRKGQVTTLQYDPLNRTTQIGFGTTENSGTISYQSTITYTYDSIGRVAEITDSQSGALRYTYDTRDRVLSETSAQGTVSYTYDSAGRPRSMTVAGQDGVTYSYDDADRITAITKGGSAVTLTYDANNRRTGLRLPNGVQGTYSYDDASRLTGLAYKLNTADIGDLTYTYDAVGRRATVGGSFAKTALPQAVASASYDAANQLTQWGTTTLSYDANGNVTNDGAVTYTWNARNQLTAINGTATTASFAYDAVGRRIGKTVNGASTAFLYDGMDIVQELDGTTPTVNLLVGGVDEVFQRTDAGGTRMPVVDALGSTLALLDDAGVVKTQYTYDPFGTTTSSGDTSSNAAQFTGRENDGTGLYFYRARYYNPIVQRFISQDPLGFNGGDVNQYVYVLNNPVNLIDPLGLFPDGPVGAPGFWESMIPVWGSGRAAVNDFQCGRWGWGIFNTAVAISDVFLIKSIATALTKGAWKFGSHTWGATRSWLTRTGWAEFPGQQFHHWFFHQNEGIGRYIPDAIKNQPWNLIGMPADRAYHQALHGGGRLRAYSIPIKLWYGNPHWLKSGIFSGMGRALDSGGRKDGCS